MHHYFEKILPISRYYSAQDFPEGNLSTQYPGRIHDFDTQKGPRLLTHPSNQVVPYKSRELGYQLAKAAPETDGGYGDPQ